MAGIALKLNRKPSDLVTMARNIHVKMGAGASVFTTPVPTLTELDTRITTLEDAIIEADKGSKLARLGKEAAIKPLCEALRLLAAYVITVSQGDASIITMAGMDLRKVGPRVYTSILSPENLRGRYTGNTGEVKLLWSRVPVAKSYIIQSTETPTVEDSWKYLTVTTKASLLLDGLERSRKIHYRVAAKSAGAISGWSEDVLVVVP
jgi:hypothetical protein